MTGPEHYLAAERLLDAAARTTANGTPADSKGLPLSPEGHAALIARAQVHAILAHTAATAMAAHSADGMTRVDFEAWDRTAGAPFERDDF